MFKHILVPLDGSTLAEYAVSYAAAFAKAFDASITLLRVLEPAYQNGCSQPVDPLDWRMCKVEAKSYLDRIASQLQQSGSPAEAILLDGDPAQHIVEMANGRSVDLVVVSSHGQGGLSGWNHGSVIGKVISRAKTSIMIVRSYKETARQSHPIAYKRIVAPLDGSRRAECVLSPAAELARFYGGRLIFAHVIARPEMPRTNPPAQEDVELANHLVERNQEEMSKIFEHLKTRLNVDVSVRIAVDDHVAPRLHELVKAEEADLVILSAHGYSGATKWPYGSVTTTFIEYGVTPLLVLQDLPAHAVEPSEAEIVSREQKGH